MSNLTAEQKQIQQTAREFVAKHIIPVAAEFDKSGEFHPFILDEAQKTQIFAMAVPKQYGGLDYSALTQALVLEEWGYGCAGMGTTLAASVLSMDSVLVAGTEEQKRRFFEPMLRGEIGSFGLTEPGAGSDAGSGKSTAVKVGDEYVLNGTKCWITNGGYATVFVIYALTDPSKGMKGLSAFIVEKGRPGFTIGTMRSQARHPQLEHRRVALQRRSHPRLQSVGQRRRRHEDRHEDPGHGAPGDRGAQRGPGAARA